MMKLNVEQDTAVKYGEGPLLIIAGAGSGKTRVITSRILHLIQEKELKSNEILALTFTEKAANEMLGRIDLKMPLGYEEMAIKTFHAFSDQILRESGLEIGIDPGYKILSQVEQWFFFKKNIFNFELDYYRPLGNPNRFIYALLNHFSKLKDEMVEANDYINFASKIEGEEGEKMRELANAYKKYQEILLENNYLDFGDLSFYANKLLEKRKSCLEKYQKKYKYILVDEFQDTNFAQFQLVLKLAKKHKNISVVGDDDQSIYKWRGASLSNILQFEKHFPNSKKIVLSKNYRSNKSILDASYQLIQNNNPDRLELKEGINKKLECQIEENHDVEVHNFPNFIEEAKFVANQIKEIAKKESKEFSDFAILIRANSHAHAFIEELKALGIPYQVKNPKGLFNLEEIKDLISLTKVLANPKDDINMLRLLKMEVFDIPMASILDLLNKSGDSLYHKLKNEDSTRTIPGLEGGKEKLKILLDDLIEFSKKNPVGLVISRFLDKSGHLRELIDQDKLEEIENINEFAKQVSKFERENETNTILDFVQYLNLLEEANAVFAVDSFTDRNSVQILTAHGSKGLEFDNVFIVNAVKQRFPSSRRSDPFSVPEELTNEIYPEGDFHIQEERRLFYVAMTRARKKLFITYSAQYEGSKKWKMSPFIEEISEYVKNFSHEESEDAISQLKQFREAKEAIFDLPRFNKKRLSYSQFSTFQTCALKYNYRYLMNIPAPYSHAANFGSSVHNTLNEFYKYLKRGESVSLELLEKLYEKNWMPYGYDSIEHEETRKKKGFELLKEFYDKNSKPWIVPAYLEKPFNIKIAEHLINGRIDRIDKLPDGSYEVIDYKTGRFREDMKLDKDLQLSIYALACRDILKLPVSKLSLYYLENNKKISTSRTEADLANLDKEILDLIQQMQSSQFNPNPGFHCGFCDFKPICPAQ